MVAVWETWVVAKHPTPSRKGARFKILMRYTMLMKLRAEVTLHGIFNSDIKPSCTVFARRHVDKAIYGAIWEVTSLAVQHAAGAVLTEPSMGRFGKLRALRYMLLLAQCWLTKPCETIWNVLQLQLLLKKALTLAGQEDATPIGFSGKTRVLTGRMPPNVR